MKLICPPPSQHHITSLVQKSCNPVIYDYWFIIILIIIYGETCGCASYPVQCSQIGSGSGDESISQNQYLLLAGQVGGRAKIVYTILQG